MRELRFRAWDNVKEQMYFVGEEDDISFELLSDGSFVGYDHKEDRDSPFQKLEHLQYMQYTGVSDKNGVLIFEGDLLKQRYSNKNVYEVVWRKNGFELKCDFTRKYEGNSWRESSFLPIHIDSYEVIGNIYEHPHLLEQEDPS